MKKVLNLILIVTFILATFATPFEVVQGKTLRDIKADVEAAEAALRENQNKHEETEEEMKRIQKEVYDNLVAVDASIKKVKEINEEIEKLNAEIDKKAEQIKAILNFIQKADSNNAYLEYIFEAEDFTDLIYRTAIAEQLSSYNKKLIDEYTELVEKNKTKKSELEQKQEQLNSQRQKLEDRYKKLSTALRSIEDAEPTLEEDVKLQRETYQFYVDLGCDLDDNIDTCGKNLLPPTTALFRPVESGYLTSLWGPRCYWLNGKTVCDFHKGLDMGKPGMAVPIYSTGTGVVVGVVEGSNAWSCGGQVVFISHNVGGKYYTSVYMHLRKIFVKKGDLVDKNTMIAYMGGSPGIETFDKCSNGQHLHFAISEGMFTTWAKAKASLIDPSTVVNFPASKYIDWYDRITKF